MHGIGDFGWRLTGLALAWIAGVALHLRQEDLWSSRVGMAASAMGAVALWLASRRRSKSARGAPGTLGVPSWLRFSVAVLGAALLGWGVSDWRAATRLADALPATLEGQDLSVTGLIANLPQRSASGLRFRFEVEQATRQGVPVQLPTRLALGWYAGFHEDAAVLQPRAELRAGQRWRFTLRLRQPHGNLNPHGFDYELALFEQGVRATGSVRDAPAPELLDRAAGHPIERARQRVRDAIEASVADRRAAGVLAALAVGDQGAIEREDWDLYRNTGIAHLVSISGLHITMFAWLAGVAIGALWRCSSRAMLWAPVAQAARWGGLLCAVSYALFSGWGVPSQRTIWMLATVTLLQACGARWPWPLVLLVAAMVVTAFDPWALLQAGFWLSFVAVGLLMASSAAGLSGTAEVGRLGAEPAQPAPAAPATSATPATPATPPAGWRNWPQRLWAVVRADVRTQLIATVGLAPLSLVFFQQVSAVGFAANLIAIPLITLVITPLALLGIALVPLWGAGAWVVQQLNAILGVLAGVPGAVLTVPAAPVWAQWSGVAAAVLLVMPLPWRARLLALPLALPLLLPARDLPAPGHFDVLAVDVGQGSSILVRTRDHLLVFDAGPQYSRDSDAAQRVLIPLLRGRGESRIDRLVLSHRDLDHTGGARSLLGAVAVTDIYSSLEAGHPLLALTAGGPGHAAVATPTHVRCAAGQAWVWDGVRFEVLRPLAADYTASKVKSNALSCVLRVSEVRGGDQSGLSDQRGRSVLLTGDIEREQEAALVASHGAALRSDVLLVAHHGSKTSSSAAFLDAVAPRVAVIQAGYRNRFGHPAADVLARLHERGAVVITSAECGAWAWTSRKPMDSGIDKGTSAEINGVCQRAEMHSYWQHRENRR